jgi:hypothetical protein
MSERATIRPVTLARLVELSNVCEPQEKTTAAVETALDVSHRRARETILEAARIGLVGERQPSAEDDATYATTTHGETFLEEIREQEWEQVSDLLRAQSPHYGAFLRAVADVEPADPDVVLERLQSDHEGEQYDFNQTSIEVLGDWGERLGAIQRNAFTGAYYRVQQYDDQSEFPDTLLSVFDELEETAGTNLSQRYLSIPELREHTCERLRCTRDCFDEALLGLAGQNIGRVELSGAPVDTEAKESALGIKQIVLAAEGELVSTDQSTERVMAGVEQYGKQYYYLAVHDEDLTYDPTTEP